jgi:hypothetical protein
MTSMIKVLAQCDQSLVLHLRGRLDMESFFGLAKLLASQQASRQRSGFLFDWSDLASWNFTIPSPHEIRVWLECAESIDRAAIVHCRRWNRQAAWFAAVLRMKNCDVRSFYLGGRDRATAWLNKVRLVE